MVDKQPFRIPKVKGLINITRVRQAERLEERKLEKRINDISGEMRESIHQLNINSKTFTNHIQRIFKPRIGRLSSYPQYHDTNRRSRRIAAATLSRFSSTEHRAEAPFEHIASHERPSGKTLLADNSLSHDQPPATNSGNQISRKFAKNRLKEGLYSNKLNKKKQDIIKQSNLETNAEVGDNKLKEPVLKESSVDRVVNFKPADEKRSFNFLRKHTVAKGRSKRKVGLMPRHTPTTPIALQTRDYTVEKVTTEMNQTEEVTSNDLLRPTVENKNSSETYFDFEFYAQVEGNIAPKHVSVHSKEDTHSFTPGIPMTPKSILKPRKSSQFINKQKHSNRQEEYSGSMTGRPRSVLGSPAGKHSYDAQILSSGLKNVFGAQPKKEVAHVVYEFLRVERIDSSSLSKSQIKRTISLDDSYEELQKCRYLRSHGLGKSV